MAEYETPAFLENHSADDFHEIGLSALPSDIDASEGGHTWNFTRSAALIGSEICEYVLPRVIQLIFPEWSYGTYLDGHARTRAMNRRAATAATGEITITGQEGSVIPLGSLFVTTSINDEPSSEYRTTEYAQIPETGVIKVGIECVTTGISGNVAAGTIVHVGSKIDGITSVTNENAVTGGTEEETDESLIARICDYDQSLGDSYGGSASDYKRWAESVDGVGSAEVIPAQDTSGLVTIVLIDANGDPANEDLRDAVYSYIMSPDDPANRKAPTGAYLSVVAPETVTIAIKATVELEDESTIESVKEAYLALILAYLPESMKDGEIKYTSITSKLSNTVGVYDYSNVQIGIVGEGGTVSYGTSNITLSDRSLPIITEDWLLLTSGTV